MGSSTWIALAVAVVLVCWMVGAYNRLVRMRGTALERYGELDARLAERRALLDRQVEAVTAVIATAAPRLDALRAACRQVDAAREQARAQAAAPTALVGLRVAEQILADARSRVPAPAGPGSGLLGELVRELQASDTALAYARAAYARAAGDYNAAAGQFPTMIVARLFGLPAVGTL